MWFKRYPQCASTSLRQRLANRKGAQGAWFELLLHETLLQLGCDVRVIDTDNTDKTPDFLAGHGDQNCYIEATTIDPADNPSAVDRNLEDAVAKIKTLDSYDFQLRLIVEGRISRTLSKNELEDKFGKLLVGNDPDEVRRGIREIGDECAPYAEIRGRNWCLRGELQPISDAQKVEGGFRELLIGPMGSYSGDASREVREGVLKKAKKYDRLDAPLIVAVNVLDIRFDRETENSALFGKEQVRYSPNHPESPAQLVRKPDGVFIQGGHKPRYTRLAGVIFFDGFVPHNPRGSVCLYVNPFGYNTALPQPLYELPHAKGVDGRLNRVEGVDVGFLLDSYWMPSRRSRTLVNHDHPNRNDIEQADLECRQ